MGKKKPKKKVKLPKDRTGRAINIGDVLQWDDGERMQVSTLTYYGSGFKGMGMWTADGEDESFSDNLEASLIVYSKGAR